MLQVLRQPNCCPSNTRHISLIHHYRCIRVIWHICRRLFIYRYRLYQ
nr:MAG TPA: hypothetical protein [Caudoviricetes sp.]